MEKLSIEEKELILNGFEEQISQLGITIYQARLMKTIIGKLDLPASEGMINYLDID